MFRYLSLCLLFLLLGGSLRAQTVPSHVASAPLSVAGVVTLVEGDARLVPAGANPRAAKLGDVVREGDVVITSKNGELHMAMQDTGFMVLRPNSRLMVVSYKADGGDDDKGVFRLLVGGLRSITGWIGRFNTSAYQVHTPTATVGIRGTDHETRYIPEGSSEGASGTYDKVYTGQTFIETSNGMAAVAPNQAGFASIKPRDKPRLLAEIPGFFRPGPHEAEIAKKHAEIQSLIDQRRNERRKVIAEKLEALATAREQVKTDLVQAKAARELASQTAEAARKETQEQREALQHDAQSLQLKFDKLKSQREELQAVAKSGQITAMELRQRRKALAEQYATLQRAQADIEKRRKALQEAVDSRIDEQFKANQERQQSIYKERLDVREKRKEVEVERESTREEIGTMQRNENHRLRMERKADRNGSSQIPEKDNETTR